jgi:hypothetical protein
MKLQLQTQIHWIQVYDICFFSNLTSLVLIKMTGILINEDDLPIDGDCSLDELHNLPM